MKKRSPLSPAQLLIYAFLFLLFTLLVILLFCSGKDEKKFTRLTHELFVEEMTSNTLTMHYNLAYPENFGIHNYKPTLPVFQPDSKKHTQELQQLLEQLRSIHPENLSESDAYTYELLKGTLENSLASGEFIYYQTPLSPSSGMQSQLPILLAEYTFRSKRDVEDYLALLGQTDAYLSSFLAFEQEKAAQGLPSSAHALKQTRHQCDTIITADALNAGTHFLQTSFEERLDDLVKQSILTPKEKTLYVKENNLLLHNIVQPAYTKLADELFLMEDAPGIPDLPSGLCRLPDGRRYYENLLIAETGSYRSIDEIKQLLQQTLRQEYQAITQLAKEHPELMEYLQNASYESLPCGDCSSILNDLQHCMQNDFPALPSSTRSGAKAIIKPVSPSLAEYCAPAFYLTTPADDSDTNVIYINQKEPISDLELFTTLAHEGYPGHLYQNVYVNQHFEKEQVNKVRQILWYGGYLEGWAIYVEFYGYDYASRILSEQGRETDALCVQLAKHNRSLLLCMYSLLDIKIHYEDGAIEDVDSFLKVFGIDDKDSARDIFCYIAEEPCNYLKYYLGYLEILSLQQEAKALWGENYSDRSFHTFFLNAGPSDFQTLSNYLEKSTSPHID